MNKHRTTIEKVFVRRTAFDDVWVVRRVRVYWPDFTPRRVAVRAREYVRSAVAALLVVASIGIGFGTVGLSGAFLSDTEASTGNTLAAQVHDFATGVAPEGLKVMPAGSSVLVPVAVTPAPGSPNLHYRFSVQYVGGVPALCNALVASTSYPFTYAGPLLALNGTSFVTPSTYVEVSLPAPVPDLAPDAPCTFTIVVSSWNALVPESTGYSDTESMQVTIVDPPAPESSAAALGVTSEVTQDEPPVPEPAPEPVPVPEPTPEPVPEVPEPTPVAEVPPQPLEETPPPVVE